MKHLDSAGKERDVPNRDDEEWREYVRSQGGTADETRKAVAPDPQARRWAFIAAAAWIVLFGGWQIRSGLHPDPGDAQAVADVRLHPTASALGSMFPASCRLWFIGHCSKSWRAVSGDDG